MRSKLLATLAVLVVGMTAWYLMRIWSEPPVVWNVPDSASLASERPQLPAPHRFEAIQPEEGAENVVPTNVLMRFGRTDAEDVPKLTLEQVEGYLRDNHRSAESLLSAFYTTREKSLLAEAKEKFPNDPHVAFVAATQVTDSPEERRKWLDVLKQSAPGNALGDYLSASDYFNSGRNDEALVDVKLALYKSLRNYQLDFLQNNQEAYRAAGYSDLEARTIASMNLQVPELSSYKKVGLSLVDMAKTYQQAGDTDSAQSLLRLAVALGQRVDEPGTFALVQKLVGLSIQRNALSAMDPNSMYGDQTVQSQLDAIKQQRDHIKSLTTAWNTILPRLSDQDIMNFHDRHSRFGELAAFEWLVNKYGTPPANGQR